MCVEALWMLPHLILAGRGAGQVLHCTWGLRGLGILRDLITQTAEEGQGQDWNPSPFDPDSRELLPPPRSASWGRGRLHLGAQSEFPLLERRDVASPGLGLTGLAFPHSEPGRCGCSDLHLRLGN